MTRERELLLNQIRNQADSIRDLMVQLEKDMFDTSTVSSQIEGAAPTHAFRQSFRAELPNCAN